MNITTPCAYHDCDLTVADGPFERVNPKGEPGIFMCTDHARIYLTFPREPSPRKRRSVEGVADTVKEGN